MSKILIVNGPNLNLLGEREPDHYGSNTLESINTFLSEEAEKLGHSLSHFQSNAEAELINCVHQAKKDGVSFIIINPAAYTHTSVALRDALSGVDIPLCFKFRLNAENELSHQSRSIFPVNVSGFNSLFSVMLVSTIEISSTS